MNSGSILGKGWGGWKGAGLVTGRVLRWTDDFLEDPSSLVDAIVYDTGTTPLYRAAFLVERGAAAILMADGGKNYHPLILAREAGAAVVAGIGEMDLAGKVVTVDSESGVIFAGEASPQRERVPADTTTDQEADGTLPAIAVYVNIGYPSALNKKVAPGVTGVGLLRVEFAVARALALNLDKRMADDRSIREVVLEKGEADAVYMIAEDQRISWILREAFCDVIRRAVTVVSGREVFVRTLDIARHFDDPMGNRGIRRDVASGGHTLRLLGEAISLILDERADANLGVILPLVSHYSQIHYAQSVLDQCGLSLRPRGKANDLSTILFGWEIEQPAASLNNRLWLASFQAAHGQPPHMIGIGTNDLTQFTIALGRDTAIQEQDQAARRYLRSLYDEHDFSVVRQICEVAAECGEVGTRLFLLGQAAADELYGPLLFALGVIPSVGVRDITRVRQQLSEVRHEGVAEGVQRYVDHVLDSYPPESRAAVSEEIQKFLQILPNSPW